MRDIGPNAHPVATTKIRKIPQQSDLLRGVNQNALSRRYPTARAALFILGLTCASLLVAAAGPPTDPPSTGGVGQAHDSVVQAQPGVLPGGLSPQEFQASQIADQSGDRDFLMVNKSLGRIILFQSGKPVFSDAALTGESMADRIPPDAISLKLSEFIGAIEYRVTPAGRFTLTRGYQEEFGLQFNINEIKGPDWTIPIQQVYRATPSERREYRLKSALQTEKQITHGGINVSDETMHFLASKLPEDRPGVLYVLPYDESKTTLYLAPHASGQSPTGVTLADPAPGSSDRDQPVVAAEVMSDQGRRVSQIAERNGDRTYIMVDKPFGKLFFFEDGKPVYFTGALTGENKSDRLPPAALKKSFSKVGTADDKVTPAGRFTLTRSYDREYGQLFSINEIHGPDWEIAIHQVYLGTPSERRMYRLASRRPDDKHVSHGCINVTRDTIKFLVTKLAKTKAPVLYILPQDQTRTLEYFSLGSG